MNDEERLRSLITDAKLREEDRQRTAKKRFQQDLETLLGSDPHEVPTDLPKLLALSYRWESEKNAQVAAFRVSQHEWVIWYGAIADDKPVGWQLDVNAASAGGSERKTYPFATMDELLLLIDKYTH